MISDFAGTGLLRSRWPSCSRSAGPCCALATAAGKASAMMAAFLIDGISPPQPLERIRKRLLFHTTVDMAGVAGKHKLIVIAFASQNSRHVLAGDDPVVHIVAHDIWIQEIPVSDFHPDPNRLDRTIRDEVLVKFPGAMRCLVAMRPLLIDRRDRICQYAVI